MTTEPTVTLTYVMHGYSIYLQEQVFYTQNESKVYNIIHTKDKYIAAIFF